MGYRQNILVSSALAPATREQALQSARSRWPFLRGPRHAEAYPDRLLLALPELTSYLFDKDADYDLAVEQSFQLESDLPAWSQEFPETVFAFVEADCFGGTCVYSGFACRNGAIMERVESGDDAHISLLQQAGIVCHGDFGPFTRTYFEGRGSGLRT